METKLKALNTIALFIPIFIGLLGLMAEGLFILAALSTMVTGLIQVVLGILYWIKFPKSISIKIYFLIVIIFFLLLFSKIADNWIWFLPPILCLYLSILVYSLKENHEK
ncbi:hypothetical protein [Flavobacterium sp.]|uniref:hypothetical protein n=1 Tax=Flavobacterium sp. TaxID=239 RepID=UPI003F69DC31